ncbi:MAG TPA: hypothetical protein QF694_00990 [Dehalococcoidia bacterium]|nr:hypothetical protein [Dehalococcoidia bacterium]HJP27372.1 hypothetical protein [Dehalococcoidia bacterium]
MMTHIGKIGKTGKPTRGAFVAEQVSQIMIKVEPRVSELRSVNKEHEGHLETLGKYQDLIENKKRHADAFNQDLRMAIQDLEKDYQNALASIDGVKQSIRVKRTTMRGIEDCMKMYKQQVFKHIAQFMPASKQRPIQQKSA